MIQLQRLWKSILHDLVWCADWRCGYHVATLLRTLNMGRFNLMPDVERRPTSRGAHFSAKMMIPTIWTMCHARFEFCAYNDPSFWQLSLARRQVDPTQLNKMKLPSRPTIHSVVVHVLQTVRTAFLIFCYSQCMILITASWRRFGRACSIEKIGNWEKMHLRFVVGSKKEQGRIEFSQYLSKICDMTIKVVLTQPSWLHFIWARKGM